MNNPTDFDIFQFLGIDATDDLEAIQKALDALPAVKMAELKKNPAFSEMRRFLFSKTTTPEFLSYVRPFLQKQKRKDRYQKNKLKEEQRKFLEEYNKREEEAKKRAKEQEEKAKRKAMEQEKKAKKQAMEQEEEAKRKAMEQEREARIKEQESKIQRLANQFNQFPNRKLSMAFVCSVLFGSFRARLLLYQLAFLVLAVCNTIFNDAYAAPEASVVLFSVPCIAIWANLYQYLLLIRTLYLFKKGKFTVGHWTETKGHWENDQGVWQESQYDSEEESGHWELAQKTIQFKDETGIICNSIVTKEKNHASFYSLFYNYEIPHDKDEPCLIVYDPINRNVNFPIAAISNPESDDITGFRTSVYITHYFYSDLNKEFHFAKTYEEFVAQQEKYPWK